jgi:outer membrane protein assembly factor BamB
MGRMLYVFNRSTGALDWEAELKGRIKSGMVVRNGYLVVLTEPRFVYGFKMESANAVIP